MKRSRAVICLLAGATILMMMLLTAKPPVNPFTAYENCSNADGLEDEGIL